MPTVYCCVQQMLDDNKGSCVILPSYYLLLPFTVYTCTLLCTYRVTSSSSLCECVDSLSTFPCLLLLSVFLNLNFKNERKCLSFRAFVYRRNFSSPPCLYQLRDAFIRPKWALREPKTPARAQIEGRDAEITSTRFRYRLLLSLGRRTLATCIYIDSSRHIPSQ